MNGFSRREKAFEAEFSHDEELKFRINARRNKLIGLWAAEIMALNPQEIESYVAGLIKKCCEAPEDIHIIDKLYNDLHDAGYEISEHRISKELKRLEKIAHEMICKGDPSEGN